MRLVISTLAALALAASCTPGAPAPAAPSAPTAGESTTPAETAPEQYGPPTTRMASFDEFIRVRCATDGSDTYTTWTGNVFSAVPGERQKLLFQVVGMNVARCWQEDDGWSFTSRELMYYLDPKSGDVLSNWSNPWTGETVPVMHVANTPIQGPLRRQVPIKLLGGSATVIMDIPLFYPNPLGRDERFAAHSPTPNYQANEFFSFTTRRSDATNPDLTTVPAMTFTWHRISQWLPWMKMGDRPGMLLFSAQGTKVAGYDALPQMIRDDIDGRLPLYRSAPRCLLDQRNESSWTYFAKHFDAYQAGERFPLPAPTAEEACKQP